MNLNKFAEIVASKEKGRKQINIGQIKQLLKIVNKLTGGVLYAIVKTLPMLLLFVVPSKSSDLIQGTLLDHVMPVTQFQSGQTKVALVDSIIRIGRIDGNSLVDIQAGFNGNTKPQPDEPTGVNLVAGGFLKISTLISTKVNYPLHWEFLRSIQHGPAVMYDFRQKEWRGSYQVGLAFNLDPVQ